jgi:hypothetical protein
MPSPDYNANGDVQKNSTGNPPGLAEADAFQQERPSPTAEKTDGDWMAVQGPDGNTLLSDAKAERKKRDRPLVKYGVVCLTIFIAWSIYLTYSSLPDTSDAAKEALKNKVSTALAVGTILLSEDEDLGQQDYTLTHEPTDQNHTKIWVWDYAAEDGDYVQVLLNGVPFGNAFMIKNKPVSFDLPINGLIGSVQIKGIRDGIGGITYAVHFDLNNTTFFNAAAATEIYTYTLALR